MELIDRITQKGLSETAFKSEFVKAFKAHYGRDYDGNLTSDSSKLTGTWALYNQKLDSKTSSGSSGGGSGGGSTKGFNFDQLRSSATFTSIGEEGVKLDTITNEARQLISLFKQPGELGRKAAKDFWNLIKDNYGLYLQQQSALRTAINKDAGLAFEFAENYREVLSEANPALLQLGVSFQSLSDSAVSLVNDTGRFYTLNEKSWVRAGEVGEAYTGTMSGLVKMLPNLEKVGIGATEAMEAIARAGKSSLSLGLRAQTVTSELNTNIGRLNEFGFSKGIDGLARMVQKSVEFRMNINETFKIADKLFSPEGAIELTANLQALGGAIGDFNDPMKLMYMATNNVEGLQDALLKASSNLATYNSEQKRFEITGVNLRYAKQMAADLGIEYSELAKGAIASAERASAASDLMRAGLTLDPKQTEFLTNIAKMKDGKMVIDVSGSKDLMNIFQSDSVALENLDKGNAELILAYQKSLEQKTEKDLVRDQATSVTNIERYVASIVAYTRKRFGPLPEEAVNETIKTITGAFTKEQYDMKTGTNVLLNGLESIAGKVKELNPSEAFREYFDYVKNEMSTQSGTKTSGATSTTSTQTTTQTTSTGTSKTATTTKTDVSSGIKSAYDTFTQSVKDMRDSFVNYVKNMSDTNTTLTNILDKLKTTFGIAQTSLTNNQNLAVQTSNTLRSSNQNPNSFASFASYNTMNNDMMTSITKSLSDKINQITTQKNKEGKEELVVQHIHKHEHLVKGDAMLDSLTRIIVRNPELFKNPDSEESYTFVPSQG